VVLAPSGAVLPAEVVDGPRVVRPSESYRFALAAVIPANEEPVRVRFDLANRLGLSLVPPRMPD